ncbi:hypothetical protein KIN20_026477 [Parelaphostrongylus tenuis]|uniref:Uncharacterized protein n=1 Tax=Parelaphostrongylus tenuis TaxID=148309 RepID=A0AAD5WCU6_PARTN|nr:hypothetical protein KIN20_026477 [Parelaphostrongylus tenuis]
MLVEASMESGSSTTPNPFPAVNNNALWNAISRLFSRLQVMVYEKLFDNFTNSSEPQECEIVGDVPTWLNGTLLRNGPGMFRIGDTKYRHWFDGMAYIQRYHFVNGKMSYSARYLESDDYKENMRAQRIVCTTFGTKMFPDPCKSIFYRMVSYFIPRDPLDNCNVAFVTASDGVYALTESPLLIRIDEDTLERQERLDIREYMSVSLHTYSAHFHSDADGNLYNIGSAFGKTSKYVLAVTKHPRIIKDGTHLRGMKTAELLAEIPASDSWAPSYYHSFGITENYFILFEGPLRINVKKLLFSTFAGWSFQNGLYWDNNAITNVLLYDRTRNSACDKKDNIGCFLHFPSCKRL